MSYDVIEVSPVTPHIGAEISGVDLTTTLSNRAVEEVHQALMDNGVIFFRDQALEPASLKRLGSYFGSLHIHPLKGMDGFPEIRQLQADENSKHVAGEEWHTDLSCDPIPPMGSILCIQTLPPSGGDTLFASMYRAYETLSDRMKAYLEGLTATHDGGKAFNRFNPGGKYPVSVHPVIRVHPVTKKKLIYVNRGFTSHINELSPEESAAVLSFLYTHCERPEWQVRFRWRKNSVAFWDNRCTQHLAVWDYFPQRRQGIRVQIDGEAVLGA